MIASQLIAGIHREMTGCSDTCLTSAGPIAFRLSERSRDHSLQREQRHHSQREGELERQDQVHPADEGVPDRLVGEAGAEPGHVVVLGVIAGIHAYVGLSRIHLRTIRTRLSQNAATRPGLIDSGGRSQAPFTLNQR